MSDHNPGELLQRLSAAVSGLERAMAAYGHLMSASQGQAELPTLVWPARDGDTPIEVHTDLNMLSDEARAEILNGMLAVHGADIQRNLTSIGQYHADLVIELTPAPAEADGAAPAASES